MDYLCNSKSEISKWKFIVFKQCKSCITMPMAVLIGFNTLREAISILSEKYKRFTFVHPVLIISTLLSMLELMKYFSSNNTAYHIWNLHDLNL